MATKTDYAQASLERLAEAESLLAEESYAGAIYLAGRASESMFKAFIEAHSKEIKGHNIATLAKIANIARRFPDPVRLKVDAAIEETSKLWANDFRYRSAENLERIAKERGYKLEIGGKVVRIQDIQDNKLRHWAEAIIESSALIVREGFRLWSKKN